MVVEGGLQNPNLELTSPGRRLGGYVLEIVLSIITLGIGWIIWYLIVATKGQSPAKQLLGMRVVLEDGASAGLGRMLVRDVVVKWIGIFGLFGLLGFLTGWEGFDIAAFFVFALAALWCAWDANRQCLWDKVVNTYVVRERTYMSPVTGATVQAPGAPAGGQAAENLRTLAELHERGLLTDEEYEERRAREAERL